MEQSVSNAILKRERSFTYFISLCLISVVSAIEYISDIFGVNQEDFISMCKYSCIENLPLKINSDFIWIRRSKLDTSIGFKIIKEVSAKIENSCDKVIFVNFAQKNIRRVFG